MKNDNQLQQLKQLLRNYEELASDMVDDDAYVARGNGFCDTKYSTDFLESQIEKIKQQIKDLNNEL